MSQPSVVLATASYDHTIKFWEAKSARCYRTIQYPESQVNRLEITHDKRFLAAAGNPHIRLFDINSNSPQPLRSFDSHTNNVMAVGFQCDGNWMYSGSEDGTVKIWDLRAPGCQREYESRAAVNTVVLHPNQTELISGDQNGNIRVWDLRANSCSCELVPEVDTAVRSLTIMWDGSLIVAANNRGTCYVWRLPQYFHSPELRKMNPRTDKLVRRTTMVATVTASYFLLTADYGPEPNVLDPIKNAIQSAEHSLKESIFRPKKGVQEHEAEKQAPSSLEKHQKSGS